MNSYDECLRNVLNTIEANLEFVTIEEIVDISGYSYYHFHRIFKAHTGESIKKYIKRLQLEKALQNLKTDNKNISQLAIESGFHMSSSFNKAFKEMFACSPSEYKNSLKNIRKNITSIAPSSIVEIDSFEVYSLRYVGECDGIYQTFETMEKFARNNHLIISEFCFYGITYDDPAITDNEKLRYDVCIPSMNETYEANEIYKKKIDGGKYAVFLNQGGPQKLFDTYNSIFIKWLYLNDIKLRNVPIIQKIPYIQPQSILDENKIEIWIPIE
jgi:AraC family transcriptional regulator